MTQFDPVDEKLEETHVELKETVSEPELAPSRREKFPSKLEREIPIAHNSKDQNLPPWKRAEQPKIWLGWESAILNNPEIHGGFWARFGANFIDWLAVNTICTIITFVLILAAGALLSVPVWTADLGYCLFSWISIGLRTCIPATNIDITFGYLLHFINHDMYIQVANLLSPVRTANIYFSFWRAGFTLFMVYGPLVVDSTYHASMESSSRQATVGKMLFRLHVTDTSGKKITLWRAYGRYFSKIVSSITLCAGYVAIGLTKKKQGFHDKIARTYVLKDYDPALLPSKAVLNLENKQPPESGQS